METHFLIEGIFEEVFEHSRDDLKRRTGCQKTSKRSVKMSDLGPPGGGVGQTEAKIGPKAAPDS